MAHRLTYHMRTHTDKADRQTKHTDKQNTQPEHTHIYIYDTHTDHTHSAHAELARKVHRGSIQTDQIYRKKHKANDNDRAHRKAHKVMDDTHRDHTQKEHTHTLTTCIRTKNTTGQDRTEQNRT